MPRRLIFVPLMFLSVAAGAQSPGDRLLGDWAGTLDVGRPFRIIIHLRRADERISATVDSPDQGATGIAADGSLRGDSMFVAIKGAFSIEGRIRHAGDTVTAVFIQGGARVALLLTRPTTARLAAPYDEQEVVVENNGIRLAGTLTRPRSSTPSPAVLLIAGSGPLDRNGVVAGQRHLSAIADYLTRAGFAVLRYDKRGVGGSTGDYESATTSTFAQDAAAALEALKTMNGVDSSRVAVVGHSEGGLIAARLAGTTAARTVVILSSPSRTGRELMLQRSELLGKSRGASNAAIEKDRRLRAAVLDALVASTDTGDARSRLMKVIASGLVEFSQSDRKELGFNDRDWNDLANVLIAQRAWFREWLSSDPRPAFRSMKVPALVVLGEVDQQVPPAITIRDMQSAMPEGSVVRTLERHNHLLQESATGSPSEYGAIPDPISSKALELVGAWLREKMTAPRPPSPTVGSIDLYGARHVSESDVRRAVAVSVGDPVPDSASKAGIVRRLRAIRGVEDAQVSGVCCNSARAMMLFVGIAERGSPRPKFRAAPRGGSRLPAEIVARDSVFQVRLAEAVRAGRTAESDSAGHEFFVDSALNAIQHEYLAFAASRIPMLRDVLSHSGIARERTLAAELLGYAPDLRLVIPDLVAAMRDQDGGVRNAAMRALGIIGAYASTNSSAGLHVPARPFIELLWSLDWTDRNKASFALWQLTASRDPALLSELRVHALPPLIDIATWTDLNHAVSGLVILGRIEGLSDPEISSALQHGKALPIVQSAQRLIRS